MAESLIVLLSGVSGLVLTGALIVLAVCWRRALRLDAKLLILSLLGVSLFHATSNFIEWMATAALLDGWEDYIELLMPALWGCLFYAFLQEQNRAELQCSEQRYRSLTDDVLDTSAAGICIVDRDCRVIWINQALEEYFGVNRDDVIGCDKRQLIRVRLKHLFEEPEAWAQRMLATCDGQAVSEGECRILPTEERPERWLEYRTRAIETGLYAGGWIEHFYDITDRKLASQHRERLLVEVESQKAELERFTYTVSHDLKSPLITIKGFVGILRDDMKCGAVDRTVSDLDRIESAAIKMEQLLGELLQLARIGRVAEPQIPTPLSEVVADALELVHGDLAARGVDVRVADDLPVVLADRTRVVEVYQNLIDNAVKYMGEQPKPQIEIGSERRGKEIRAFVRDNGIGIESRYGRKIFGLFEQLDPRQDGTGVGLAVVKRIVETHGGRIWVESDGADMGSTFYFTLSEAEGETAAGDASRDVAEP